jgi:hypothetical protein
MCADPVTVTVDRVSPAAVALLKTQLLGFGAVITDDLVVTPSGEMRFRHEGLVLEVVVVKDHGHFPRLLLIGGIRQMIEEAVELAG